MMSRRLMWRGIQMRVENHQSLPPKKSFTGGIPPSYPVLIYLTFYCKCICESAVFKALALLPQEGVSDSGHYVTWRQSRKWEMDLSYDDDNPCSTTGGRYILSSLVEGPGAFYRAWGYSTSGPKRFDSVSFRGIPTSMPRLPKFTKRFDSVSFAAFRLRCPGCRN
ncbi:hypothetical protein NC652_000006 [Populus alba x Populus x berolinensis]|nr:hypothetical protein NC652_000006 [Populus alba x Populus x berolinensis]